MGGGVGVFVVECEGVESALAGILASREHVFKSRERKRPESITLAQIFSGRLRSRLAKIPALLRSEWSRLSPQ